MVPKNIEWLCAIDRLYRAWYSVLEPSPPPLPPPSFSVATEFGIYKFEILSCNRQFIHYQSGYRYQFK
jgi:hypothetical protein